MNMSEYTQEQNSEAMRLLKLKRHCEAIRRNKVIVAAIFQYLDHMQEGGPNASAAKEALSELSPEDQMAIWSVSTTQGGIWETWERDAMKYGDLEATNSWSVWSRK